MKIAAGGTESYYWEEDVPFEDIFRVNGVGPPSSRNNLETPISPPPLVERRAPVKRGRRFTSCPSWTPGAAIP